MEIKRSDPCGRYMVTRAHSVQMIINFNEFAVHGCFNAGVRWKKKRKENILRQSCRSDHNRKS